jgi:PPOX class probable F420-dependent enzyme
MVKLTPEQRKLIEEPNLAHVATLMKDGSPQVTPVWVDCDDTHILINTAEGRQKPRNLERDPRIALSIARQEDQQMYIQVRGRVVEITREGAFEHISKLGRKYFGEDFVYPKRPGETRIIIRIEPESVTGRA